MTNKANTKTLIREMQENVAKYGRENTTTYLMVQAINALQQQDRELEALGAGGVQALSAGPVAPFPGMHEPWPEHQKQRLQQVCSEIFGWAPTPPAEQPAMESVLVDGIAYPTPAPVAGELLRLHLELLGATTGAALRGQPARPCVICGSDEPFTGTCGSGDPRALCKQAAPEAKAQPGAVYANKPDSVAWLAEYGGDVFTAAQLLDFADRTHALRLDNASGIDWGKRARELHNAFGDTQKPEYSGCTEQAAPKAAPGEQQDRAAFFAWWGPYQLPEYWASRIDVVAWHAWQAAMAQAASKAAPQQEAQEPVAWLVPTLQTFKGAERVHFTRAPGCAMTDAELIDHMEGRVVWIAKTFSDSPGVTDKFGVEHKPKPLYTTPQSAAPQAAPAVLSERDAFESAWAKLHGRPPILWSQMFAQHKMETPAHSEGKYFFGEAQAAWTLWQARAALAAQGGA